MPQNRRAAKTGGRHWARAPLALPHKRHFHMWQVYMALEESRLVLPGEGGWKSGQGGQSYAQAHNFFLFPPSRRVTTCCSWKLLTCCSLTGPPNGAARLVPQPARLWRGPDYSSLNPSMDGCLACRLSGKALSVAARSHYQHKGVFITCYN